jgi:hypothetical protein
MFFFCTCLWGVVTGSAVHFMSLIVCVGTRLL